MKSKKEKVKSQNEKNAKYLYSSAEHVQVLGVIQTIILLSFSSLPIPSLYEIVPFE